MTHTSWNMGGKNPASQDVRRLASLLLLSLNLLVSAAPVRAANPPTGSFPVTSSTRRENDLEIETKVRRALRKDVQLGSLNLNVHVAGGTARLSGPVPSPEYRQRAVKIAEGVEGVLKVTAGDLYVSSTAQGPKRVSVLLEDDQPTQTRSASPHSLLNGMAPSSPGGERGVSPRLVHPDGGDPAPSGPQVTLQAPEPAPRPARVPEAAQLTANPRPASPVVSIATALEQLRQRDRRFRQIRTQVRGTTVCIFPDEAPAEDAMMFAQAVRRLPGVQYVVVAPGSR